MSIPEKNSNYPYPLNLNCVYRILYNKYNITSELYRVMIINQILYNSQRKVVVDFKEHLMFDENIEFLKRFYLYKEAIIRIPKLCVFYCLYSKIFPNYTVLHEKKYIYRNIQRKQKMIDIQEEIESKEIKHKIKNHNGFNYGNYINNNSHYSKMFKSDVYHSLWNDINNEDVFHLFNINNNTNTHNDEDELFMNMVDRIINVIEKCSNCVNNNNNNNINTTTVINNNNNNNNYNWRPNKSNQIYEKFINSKTCKIQFNKVPITQRSLIHKIEQTLFKNKQKYNHNNINNNNSNNTNNRSQSIHQTLSQSYSNNRNTSTALSATLNISSSFSKLNKLRHIYQKELPKQITIRPNHLQLNKQTIKQHYRGNSEDMCIPLSPLTDRQNVQEHFTRNTTIVNNSNNNNKYTQNVKQINNYNSNNVKSSTIQIQKKLLVKMGNKKFDLMKLKQKKNINEDSMLISRNKLGFKSIKVANNNSLRLASRNEIGNDWKRKSCQNKSNGNSSYKLSPKSAIKDVKGISIYNFSKLFNMSLTKFKNKNSVEKGKVYKLKSE